MSTMQAASALLYEVERYRLHISANGLDNSPTDLTDAQGLTIQQMQDVYTFSEDYVKFMRNLVVTQSDRQVLLSQVIVRAE